MSSVFELLKIKDNEASIRDLYDQEEYLVEEIEKSYPHHLEGLLILFENKHLIS